MISRSKPITDPPDTILCDRLQESGAGVPVFFIVSDLVKDVTCLILSTSATDRHGIGMQILNSLLRLPRYVSVMQVGLVQRIVLHPVIPAVCLEDKEQCITYHLYSKQHCLNVLFWCTTVCRVITWVLQKKPDRKNLD